ncbi:UNVERIFIED_CONTAM: hypothetical protein NCL1_32458 [Trichonephila clavipes]
MYVEELYAVMACEFYKLRIFTFELAFKKKFTSINLVEKYLCIIRIHGFCSPIIHYLGHTIYLKSFENHSYNSFILTLELIQTYFVLNIKEIVQKN